MFYALRKFLAIAGALLTLLVFTGCASFSLPVRISEQPSQLKLEIASIEPTGRPGAYSLSGTTNLPDDTEIALSAIRYLQPNAEVLLNAKPTYAILSRQPVKVSQGTWKTTLNLWHVAPDGSYQEAWQAATDVAATVNPESKIMFVATLEPSSLSPSLKQQLTSENKSSEGVAARFTSDGEAYLQASRTVTLALPSGKTNPPAPRSEDVNGGWGDRSRLPAASTSSSSAAPASAKFDATTAPLNPEEFLR